MRFFEPWPAILLCPLLVALAVVPARSLAVATQSTAAALPTFRPSAGNELHHRALGLIAKGDLVGAEKALKESLKRDPHNAEVFLALAEIRLRQGKLDEAAVFVREAMVAEPGSANVLVAQGNILLLKKDATGAESAYRKALAIDKDNVSAYMGLGELYLRVLGKPQDAVDAYSHAAALNPQLAPAQFALGAAYATAKKPDQAIEAFQAAGKLAPTDPQPLHAMGRVQASDKRLEAAVESFSAALAANPDYLPALVDRADALAELERNREALSDYERVLKKQPGDAQLWLKLGLMNQRLQHRDEAVRSYQKAVSLNPNMPLAYNNLAWLAIEEKRDLDQALAWSTKATTLAANVPQFHDTLGWVYRARGDLEMSRKSLETAARLQPPQAQVSYHLGIVLQEQGNKNAAIAAFKRALQIDGSFSGAADAGKRLAQLSK